MDAGTIEAVAAELAAAWASGRTLRQFSEVYPGFSVDDAYAIADRLCEMRRARGETPVGRKVGATNVASQRVLGVNGPLWNYVYDTTTREVAPSGAELSLRGFPHVRIEPEIVLRVAATPRSGMSDSEILACCDGVAHGFEVVASPFGDWHIGAADATAAYGVHMSLLIGPWHDVTDDRPGWAKRLRDFTVTLRSDSGTVRTGAGINVLGSPMRALRYLVEELATSGRPGLEPGEVVTTGTLTEPVPAAPGETWTTVIDGVSLEGLKLTLTD